MELEPYYTPTFEASSLPRCSYDKLGMTKELEIPLSEAPVSWANHGASKSVGQTVPFGILKTNLRKSYVETWKLTPGTGTRKKKYHKRKNIIYYASNSRFRASFWLCINLGRPPVNTWRFRREMEETFRWTTYVLNAGIYINPESKRKKHPHQSWTCQKLQQTSLKSQNWQYNLFIWYSYIPYIYIMLTIDKLQFFKKCFKGRHLKKKNTSLFQKNNTSKAMSFFFRFSALFWKGQNTVRCEDPIPIGSMYGKFTYMYHKNQLNAG